MKIVESTGWFVTWRSTYVAKDGKEISFQHRASVGAFVFEETPDGIIGMPMVTADGGVLVRASEVVSGDMWELVGPNDR